MPETLARRVGRLGAGDHACLVCESDEERWGAVSSYLRQGLDRNERTVYVTADRSEEEARELLDLHGASSDELAIVPAAIAHGYSNRRFDYVERLAGWRGMVLASVADGFAGLRVAGDMTWLHDVDLSHEQLVDYERRGTELVEDVPGTVLCVYDRRRFDDHLLARAGHAHRICLGHCATPALVYDSHMMSIATAGPGALRLSGEIDASNVEALSNALASSLDGGGLLVDMSRVEFIDVAGVRTIHEASRRLEERGERMVLLSPRPTVRKMMALLGVDEAVAVDEVA